MATQTTEGTGPGSVAEQKKLVINGQVLVNNIAPHCLENYEGDLVLLDGKIVFPDNTVLTSATKAKVGSYSVANGKINLG